MPDLSQAEQHVRSIQVYFHPHSAEADLRRLRRRRVHVIVTHSPSKTGKADVISLMYVAIMTFR